jgi:hypothetical protein
MTFVDDNASDNASDSDTLVLALATLGGATRNRNDPICVVSSKVARASTIVSDC